MHSNLGGGDDPSDACSGAGGEALGRTHKHTNEEGSMWAQECAKSMEPHQHKWLDKRQAVPLPYTLKISSDNRLLKRFQDREGSKSPRPPGGSNDTGWSETIVHTLQQQRADKCAYRA
eukprot:2884153-Amphidinium_carterae.1